MRRILYITYDGLTDPLGQSQILAYLKRLSFHGNQIVILSYEKDELYKKNGEVIKKIVEQNNLIWVPLRYSKTPPVLSTIYDINKGYRVCKQLHDKYKFQVVHCRGYIPAILGKRLKKKHGLKFIFDMRGWWADEKLESGFWNKKIYRPVYHFFKKLEKEFFKDCDYAVSLTYRGKKEIKKQGLANIDKIGVIPTCVDFDIFKPWNASVRKEVRAQLRISDDEKIFIYSGSLGGNYDPDTLISVFKEFEKLFPESFLLILSKDSFGEDLKTKFTSQGVNKLAIYNAPFTEVTKYLVAADVGFIYYKMSFSTIGRSPTKLGEYWASGIPVLAFKGIGDLDFILDKYPDSGVLLSEDKLKWPEEIKALTFIDPKDLRQYSEDYFHIDKGVQFYQQAYQLLIPTAKEVYEPVNNENPV